MSPADEELIAVASYASRVEVELAASRLRAAGIESLISGPDAGGTLQAVAGGLRLLVHAARAAEASELLEAPPVPD